MTKWDKVLIACIMVLSATLIVPILYGAPQASTVAVNVKNKEVLRVSLAVDDTYVVSGSLGDVVIEVADGAVRVTQENSPHHYCSLQGWVSSSAVPIVCLPNDTVVQIQADDAMEDTVIQ